HPTAHAPGDIVGHLAHAMEQHVTVAQQNAMVMVVWMADLPEYFAVPVGLEDHATFEWKAAQEVLLGSSPIIEQRSALAEITRHAWRIGHLPGVTDAPLKIDEIHRSVLHEVRDKESESWRGAFLI